VDLEGDVEECGGKLVFLFHGIDLMATWRSRRFLKKQTCPSAVSL
jgi:hypothetical protein